MAASSNSEMDINLTPLLDLILQLIMFFLACVNFAADQASSDVQLPISISAQEIQPKTEEDYILINIELVRKPRLAPNGEPVKDAKDNPVRDPVEPRTFKFKIHGGDEIVFLDRPDQKSIGLGRAMNRMKTLGENLKLRISARDKVDLKNVKEIKVPVIVRGDVETEYQLIYQLIQQCKNAGFSRVELRAVTRLP
jgi:biopolymer transport protein ExbD